MAVDKLTRTACAPSMPTYKLNELANLLASTYQPEAQRTAAAPEAGNARQSRRAMDK